MIRFLSFIALLLIPVLFFAVTSCTDEKTSTSSAPANIAKQVKQGASIFKKKCMNCHGENAQGGICPNLVDDEWKYGGTDDDIYKSISEGRPGGMPNWNETLGEEKIKSVIAYIRNLNAK
jgi:cbb3-type cytochrome c oxidase subunit III